MAELLTNHEIVARVDIQADQVVAIYPQDNENAWLLGQAALRRDREVGMVGARGVAPSPYESVRVVRHQREEYPSAGRIGVLAHMAILAGMTGAD